MADRIVRNMKGEIVEHRHREEKEEWSLGDLLFAPDTLALLGGSILLIFGAFPGAADAITPMLNVMLWPWWYFPMLAVFAFCVYRWISQYVVYKQEGFNDRETIECIRFKRLSLFVCGQMLVLVLLKSLNLIGYLSYPMVYWLGHGRFSWTALLVFSTVLACVVITITLAKGWLEHYLQA